MAWVRLDSKIINKDWIADLTDAEFRAWVHLIAFAADFEGDGIIPISSDKRLAECLHVPLKVLRSLLLRAELLQKIERKSETSWLQVRNYSKYNPQYLTNKRVEKFRENKDLAKKNSVTSPVTRNTNETENEYDNDTSKKILKKETGETPQTVFQKWNETALELGLPTLTTLSKSLSDKIKTRLRDPVFKPDEIFKAIPNLPPFWLGKDEKNYMINLEYLVRNDNNYLKIISLGKSKANGHVPKYSEEGILVK